MVTYEVTIFTDSGNRVCRFLYKEDAEAFEQAQATLDEVFATAIRKVHD